MLCEKKGCEGKKKKAWLPVGVLMETLVALKKKVEPRRKRRRGTLNERRGGLT